MVTIAVLGLVLAAGCSALAAATGGWRRVLVRWQWARICRSVGVAVRRDRLTSKVPGPGDKASPINQVEHRPVLLGLFGRPIGPLTHRLGATWRVWAAVGQTTSELAAQADRFAATVWCQRAIIEPRTHRSARLTLLWRDPFALTARWYPALYGRFRPAFDVHQRPVDVPIIDSWGGSWLIAASSGSGKSAWLNALLADLVRQPAGTVTILGIDLKRVELGPWRPAMARLATDLPAAVELLRWARALIDHRTVQLEAAGLRHVPDTPTRAWPYVVIAIDELGALLNGKGAGVDEVKALLADIAMLGRFAGVLIIGAMQRPTTDLLPGAIRDNLGRRVLLRVANLDQGQAVLGWRPDQATIDQLNTPGLALIDLPGRDPFLARSTWGEVTDVEALVTTPALRLAA